MNTQKTPGVPVFYMGLYIIGAIIIICLIYMLMPSSKRAAAIQATTQTIVADAAPEIVFDACGYNAATETWDGKRAGLSFSQTSFDGFIHVHHNYEERTDCPNAHNCMTGPDPSGISNKTEVITNIKNLGPQCYQEIFDLIVTGSKERGSWCDADGCVYDLVELIIAAAPTKEQVQSLSTKFAPFIRAQKIRDAKEEAEAQAEEAKDRAAEIKRKANERWRCSLAHINADCCNKACSGAESIGSCLADYYFSGCRTIDEGSSLSCGCGY
jgi:hypothetical protein